MRRAATLAAMLAAAPAFAAPGPRLYADLSAPKVEITYGYAGARLMVYGAVQYPGGKLPGETPKIAIVARGPDQQITVRRKEKVAGVWVNTQSEQFATAPSFYAVATTAPLTDLIDARTAAVWELGLGFIQYSPIGSDDPTAAGIFQRGLVDLRRGQGLYREDIGAVRVTDDILYRADLFVPPAAPVGDYDVTVYLVRDGKVVATIARKLSVEKTGFEARVSDFAARDALLYGLATVALAAAAGWVASLIVGRRG